MQPYGGTEIQFDYLKKYCSNHWDSVQITTSVPEKEPLHPVRSNILWLKNSFVLGSLASLKKVSGGPCSTIIPRSVK